MVAGLEWTPGLFLPHPRMIGGIVAEVTIEEVERDELVITEHPVEQGAPIADHAFKRPSVVVIRAGWSMSGSFDMSADSGVYRLLLQWQAALIPFDVITGKRSYSNMLMESLTVTTDQTSEFALMANITCRQVIIVSTETTKVTASSSTAGNHKAPETTAPTDDRGVDRGNFLTTGDSRIDLVTGTGDFDLSGDFSLGTPADPGLTPQPLRPRP